MSSHKVVFFGLSLVAFLVRPDMADSLRIACVRHTVADRSPGEADPSLVQKSDTTFSMEGKSNQDIESATVKISQDESQDESVAADSPKSSSLSLLEMNCLLNMCGGGNAGTNDRGQQQVYTDSKKKKPNGPRNFPDGGPQSAAMQVEREAEAARQAAERARQQQLDQAIRKLKLHQKDVIQTVLAFLDTRELLKAQLVSPEWYDKQVPLVLSALPDNRMRNRVNAALAEIPSIVPVEWKKDYKRFETNIRLRSQLQPLLLQDMQEVLQEQQLHVHFPPRVTTEQHVHDENGDHFRNNTETFRETFSIPLSSDSEAYMTPFNVVREFIFTQRDNGDTASQLVEKLVVGSEDGPVGSYKKLERSISARYMTSTNVTPSHITYSAFDGIYNLVVDMRDYPPQIMQSPSDNYPPRKKTRRELSLATSLLKFAYTNLGCANNRAPWQWYRVCEEQLPRRIEEVAAQGL